MRKKVGIIKRMSCLLLIFLLSINSFAAIVSDNDGSAFITKSEFDALKSSFQSQIDTYNNSIDSKIDGAIASYLAGIKLDTAFEVAVRIGDEVHPNTIMRSCVISTYDNRFNFTGKNGNDFLIALAHSSYGYLDSGQWYETMMSYKGYGLSAYSSPVNSWQNLPFHWYIAISRRDWTRRKGSGQMYWSSKGSWGYAGYGALINKNIWSADFSGSYRKNFGFPIFCREPSRAQEIDNTSGTSSWPSSTAYALYSLVDPEERGEYYFSQTKYYTDTFADFTYSTDFAKGWKIPVTLASNSTRDGAGNYAIWVPEYVWVRPFRFRDYIDWDNCNIVVEAKFVDRTWQWEGQFRAAMQVGLHGVDSIRPDPALDTFSYINFAEGSIPSDWFTIYDSRTDSMKSGTLGFAIAQEQASVTTSSNKLNVMEDNLKLRTIDLRYTVYDAAGSEVRQPALEFWHDGVYYPNGYTAP